MNVRCPDCHIEYDDARCFTICPHEAFLSVDAAAQKDAALALLGKRVYFAHLAPGEAKVRGMKPARVTTVTGDGMVCIEEWPGAFAPHLFVVAEE
jgi:hypothetical protein